MFKKYLLLIIVMFGITKFLNAQGTIVASVGPQRTMEQDMIGFNGQNTTSSAGQSWNDMNSNSNAQSSLNKLSIGSLRYPGGTVANYWNWRDGVFLKKHELLNENKLPDEFVDYTPINEGENDYKTFGNSLKFANARPLWVWNIMNSDYNFQLASLYGAKSEALSTKYIEFGNEFYLGEHNYYLAFNTATNYAQQAADWAGQLHQEPKFTNVKIGVVGCSENNERYGRRNLWLDRVLSVVKGNSDIDAVTVHVYVGNGLSNESSCLSGFTITNLNNGLARAFKQVDDLKSNEFRKIKGAGKNIWLTEFNMTDKNKPTHGSWFHALFASSMGLAFLEEEAVTKIVPHTLVGNAVFSGIFPDAGNAFDNLGQFQSPINTACSTTTNLQSQSWQLSALGNAYSFIAKAAKNSISGEPITFPGASPLSSVQGLNGYKNVYGWQFNKTNGSKDLIIINYGGTYTLDLSDLIPNSPNYTTTYNFLQGELAEYPQGNATFTTSSSDNQLLTLANYASLSQTIDVNGYTIYHINYKRNSAPPDVVILEDSLCCDQTTSAMAYDINFNEGYYWKINNLENYNNPVIITSIEGTEFTNISVELFNANNERLVNKTIVSSPCITKPEILVDGSVPGNNNTIEFCPNGFPSFQLSTSWTPNNTIDYAYMWTPSLSVVDVRSQSTIIYPEETTEYQLFVTNGSCWLASDKVKFISQKPEVSFELEDDSIELCSNYELELEVLQPTGANYNYSWFNNYIQVGNNTSTYLETNFLNSGLISVNVINNSNQCSDTLYKYVGARSCCFYPPAPSHVQEVIPSIFNDYKIDVSMLIADISNFLAANTSVANSNNTTTITSNNSDVIIMNGDFIVNKNLTLINCTIEFGENASITLNPNRTLKLEGCTLRRCNGSSLAWKGIIANNETQDIIITNNSTGTNTLIEGAHTAIDASNDVAISLENVQFEDNLQSVYLHEYKAKVKTPSSVNNTTPITGCTFNATSNPFPQPFANLGYLYPRAYIVLANVPGLQIGNTNQAPLFNGANTGILSDNSSFTLHNSRFANMQNYTSAKKQLGLGNAIYSYNTKADNGRYVEIGDASATTSNQFNDCPTSITLNDDVIATVTKNIFNGGAKNDFDITLINNYEADINIIDNDFNDVQTGIYGYNLGLLNKLNIINNRFTDPSLVSVNPNFQHCAITLQNPINLRPSYLNILSNSITNLRLGIHVSNINNTLVRGNQINFQYSSPTNINLPAIGTWLQSSNSSTIIDNIITNINTMYGAATQLKGLSLENCSDGKVKCNTIENTGYSSYINAICLNTFFNENTFTNYDVGVFLDGAIVSDQGSQGDPALNQWSDNSSPTKQRVDGTPGTSPSDWYHNGVGSSPLNVAPCNNIIANPVYTTRIVYSTPCSLSNPDPQERAAAYNNMINDTTNENEFYEEQAYLRKQSIYELIAHDSTNTEINSFVSVADFLVNMEASNLKLLLNKEKTILDHESINDSLNLILINANTHENNRKQFNEKLFNANKRNELNASDSSYFQFLSLNDLVESGTAVVGSRSAIFKEVHPTSFNSFRKKKMNNDNNRNQVVNIYPNPTSSKIYFEMDEFESLTITIKSLIGAFVKKQIIATQKDFIDLTNCIEGVYYLEIMNENNLMIDSKIIIKQ